VKADAAFAASALLSSQIFNLEEDDEQKDDQDQGK
jgi:hypothetical protein